MIFIILLFLSCQYLIYCELICYKCSNRCHLLRKRIDVLKKYNSNIPLDGDERNILKKIPVCFSETSCYAAQNYYLEEKLINEEKISFFGCKFDMEYNNSREDNLHIYECNNKFCNYKQKDAMFQLKCLCNNNNCKNSTIVCQLGETCWRNGDINGCKSSDYDVPKNEMTCRSHLCNFVYDTSKKKMVDCHVLRSFMNHDNIIIPNTKKCHQCVIAVVHTPFGLYYSQNCKSTVFPKNVMKIACEGANCNTQKFLKQIVKTICHFNFSKELKNRWQEECQFINLDNGHLMHCPPTKTHECYKSPFMKTQVNYEEKFNECIVCKENCKTNIDNLEYVVCSGKMEACYINYYTKTFDYDFITGCLNKTKDELSKLHISEPSFKIENKFCIYSHCNSKANIKKYAPRHLVMCNNCSKFSDGYCISQGIVHCYNTHFCTTYKSGSNYLNFSCGPSCKETDDVCCKGDLCNTQHIEIKKNRTNIFCKDCELNDCINSSKVCASSICYISYDFENNNYKFGCNDNCRDKNNIRKYVYCCKYNNCNSNKYVVKDVKDEVNKLKDSITDEIQTCYKCEFINSLCMSLIHITCKQKNNYCMNMKKFYKGGFINVIPMGCVDTCLRNKSISCCKKKDCNLVGPEQYKAFGDYNSNSMLDDHLSTSTPKLTKVNKVIYLFLYCSGATICISSMIYIAMICSDNKYEEYANNK